MRLVVWPWPLILDYGWPVARDTSAIALPAVAVGAFVVLAVWTFRHHPQLGFLGVAFFLLLAPSSSVIPIRDLAVEHRMYLPLAPLVALIVLGADRLLRAFAGSAPVRRGLSLVLVTTSAAVLMLMTVRRNAEYGDPIAMWRDVAVRRPTNARVQNNLAHLLIAAGRVEEAAPYATRAVDLVPSYAQAHNSLGVVLREQGRADAAIREFSEALRLDPNYAEAYNNRGLMRMGLGRIGDAIADYEHALRIMPNYAEVHGNMGTARLTQGNFPEAVREYGIALRLAPNRGEMHYNLALALSAQGNVEEARVHYAEAARLKPGLRAPR